MQAASRERLTPRRDSPHTTSRRRQRRRKSAGATGRGAPARRAAGRRARARSWARWIRGVKARGSAGRCGASRPRWRERWRWRAADCGRWARGASWVCPSRGKACRAARKRRRAQRRRERALVTQSLRTCAEGCAEGCAERVRRARAEQEVMRRGRRALHPTPHMREGAHRRATHGWALATRRRSWRRRGKGCRAATLGCHR